MRVIEANIPASPFDPRLAKKRVPVELTFHERLFAFRKERVLTQQALANLVKMHISQIRRCGNDEKWRLQPGAASPARSGREKCDPLCDRDHHPAQYLQDTKAPLC